MIGWLLLAAAAWAGPDTPTLERVLQSVVTHGPQILAAEAKLRGAEGAMLGSTGVYDPSLGVLFGSRNGPYDSLYVDGSVSQQTPLYGLSLEAGYRVGLGKFPGYDGLLDTLDRGELYAGVRLPLLKGALTDEARTEVLLSRLELVRAEAALQAKQVEVGRKAREAWFKWLAQGAKLAVATDMLDVSRTSQSAIRTRVERGGAAPIDLVDIERVVVERQGKRISLQRDLRAAALQLGLYLRDAEGRPSPPDGMPPDLPTPAQIPDFDEPALIESAWQMRPDVAVLTTVVSAADARVRLARWGALPKLDVKLGLAQDLAAEGEASEPFDVKVGAELAFPLLLRSGRGKLAEGRAKQELASQDLRWARDVVAAEVSTSVASVVAAHEQARLAERTVELATTLLEATRRRYDLGDTDLFSVYLREQSVMKARLEAVDAWTVVQLAEASLNAALGRR